VPLTVVSGWFQWAPTLGGECYLAWRPSETANTNLICFNGHPPLGVNATLRITIALGYIHTSFNGHPPLGVNATTNSKSSLNTSSPGTSFNGHPPLGVNATGENAPRF